MARDFNGSTQRLEGTMAAVNVPLTMACWMYPDNVTASLTVMQVGVAGASDQSRLTLNVHGALAGDPIRCTTVNSAGTSSFASTSTGYVANSWQHICAVYSGTSARAVFLNGAGKGTDSSSRPVNDMSTVNIGCSQTTTGTYPGYFAGRIAEAAIWNVALSDAEVALLAKGMKPTQIQPANLIEYWPLIGRVSPEPGLYEGTGLALTNSPAAAEHLRMVEPLEC
jgi:hypothetical protein